MCFYFRFIHLGILCEIYISASLCRTIWVWICEKFLDSKKNLFDCDGRHPTFVFVQDTQADRPRRIDIGMIEVWRELALWWPLWILFWKNNVKWIVTSFPKRSLLSWDMTLPVHQVHRTIVFGLWPSEEPLRCVNVCVVQSQVEHI